jgi:hypothetical protein
VRLHRVDVPARWPIAVAVRHPVRSLVATAGAMTRTVEQVFVLDVAEKLELLFA